MGQHDQDAWKAAALIILSMAAGLSLVIIALGVAFFGATMKSDTGYAAVLLAIVGTVTAYLGVRHKNGNG